MPKEFKRALILLAAFAFLILGIAGIVLPVLQGFIFLLISAVLFSISSSRVREWADSHTVRYPKLHKTVLKMRAKIERMIGET